MIVTRLKENTVEVSTALQNERFLILKMPVGCNAGSGFHSNQSGRPASGGINKQRLSLDANTGFYPGQSHCPQDVQGSRFWQPGIETRRMADRLHQTGPQGDWRSNSFGCKCQRAHKRVEALELSLTSGTATAKVLFK